MSETRSPAQEATGTNRPERLQPVRRSGGISVIVPVAPWDMEWQRLVPDLVPLSEGDEILVVGTQPEPADFRQFVAGCGLVAEVRWLAASTGRAVQMNHGARAAAGQWLWFLHADSRVFPAAIEELKRALADDPAALHHFRLRFLEDGPRAMALNELGVRFRSRVLKMPFGDQGFCLQRALFESLGGYDETSAYGEDHLLVWAARRRGIPLRGARTALGTSARKYRAGGWFRTTARHLWLTFLQAVPQYCLLLRERLRRHSRRGKPPAAGRNRCENGSQT